VFHDLMAKRSAPSAIILARLAGGPRTLVIKRPKHAMVGMLLVVHEDAERLRTWFVKSRKNEESVPVAAGELFIFHCDLSGRAHIEIREVELTRRAIRRADGANTGQ
jgi:hypothetical protein